MDTAATPPLFSTLELKRIVREAERRKITGLSRTHWYRMELAGKVPKRVKLGETAHGWPLEELLTWLDERRAARNEGGDLV